MASNRRARPRFAGLRRLYNTTMAYDPTKNQGQRTDDIDPAVLGLPFINIIQKGSAEFDETHRFHKDKKIEGCKPGDILFTQKRKVLARPLLVIPVAQTTLYTEWKSREAGGGFVGNRALSVATDRNYRRGTPGSPTEYKEYLGSNELIYTMYFMVIFKQGDAWEKGVIAFTGAQLKHARKWSRSIKEVSYDNLPSSVTPPIFAASYQVSTAPESGNKGGWMGWSITLDRIMDFTKDEALLTQAEAASVDAAKTLPSPAYTPKAIAALVTTPMKEPAF